MRRGTRARVLGLAVAATLPLAATACNGSPRLDTSSDEAMMASIAKMNAELTEPRRRELTQSIATLVAPRLAERSSATLYQGNTAELSQAELMRPYDGLTAGQLIARAKEKAR